MEEMEVESASMSPAPNDQMDREPRLAAQQAEGVDREELRMELTSFTKEDGLGSEGDRTRPGLISPTGPRKWTERFRRE